MKNLQREFVWLPILIGVIIVAALGGGLYVWQRGIIFTTPISPSSNNTPELTAEEPKEGLLKAQAISLISDIQMLSDDLKKYHKEKQTYPSSIEAFINDNSYTGRSVFISMDRITKYQYQYVVSPDRKNFVLYATIPLSKNKIGSVNNKSIDTVKNTILGIACSAPNLFCSTDVSVSSIATADSSWKTYTNTNYGYSIKYPSSWTVEPEKQIVDKVNNIYSNVKIHDSTNAHAIQVQVNGKEWLLKHETLQTAQVTIKGSAQTAYMFPNGYECYGTKSSDDCSFFVIPILSKGVRYELHANGDARTVTQLYKDIFSTFTLSSQASITHPKTPLITYASSNKSMAIISNGQIDSSGRVYVVGSNLLPVACTGVNNCGTAVYVGNKQGTIEIPKSVDGNSLNFIAPELANGNYDLYIVNLSTGQKSNVLTVQVLQR